MISIENTELEGISVMESYFDRTAAMKYCGGSEEIYVDVLKSYVDQGKKYLEQLEDHFNNTRWKDYAVIAHALKNSSKTIGALTLSDMALELEISGKIGNGEVVNARHKSFLDELRFAIKEAEHLLEARDNLTRGSLSAKRLQRVQDTTATILIVDDDSTNIALAQSFLSQEFRIIGVKSGRMAMKYLKKNTPDLIMLDLIMPEMNGLEVMEKLQSDYRTSIIPVIFLTADRNPDTEEVCFRKGGMDFITKPFIPSVVHQRVRRVLELESYKHNLERMVADQLQRITQLQADIIISMGNLVESRDGTTGEHIKRTAIYTEYLARKSMLSGLHTDILTENYISYLCKAAPLHDIGKISVSDLILQKPGKLDNNEFAKMKLHTVEGDRIIRKNMFNIADQKFVDMAADVARHHHEKWNGKGYPDGLAGEDIPLSARVLAIADVFDALIAKRPYKEGFPFPKAVAIMEEERGRSFEPELLDVFLKNKDELRALVEKIN